MSLPTADFFDVVFKQHSKNLDRFCIYQVRGEGLSGGGKVHLKCSNNKLVKDNFANLQ